MMYVKTMYVMLEKLSKC